MSVKEKRTKWFSILMALLPLFSYYSSPISEVDMGSFLLLVFSVSAVPRLWYKCDFMRLYLYVLCMTPFAVFLLAEQNAAIMTIILRYAKFVVVLGCVFGFGFFKNYYDEQMTFKTMKFVIYLCAAFIVLQRIFHSVGITIANPLIQFATHDAYLDGYSMGTILFRPSAFFLEPSHLSVYGVVYLGYSLFKMDNIKQSMIVFITILCSGSGIGLVFGMLIYCAYFLIQFREHIAKIFASMCTGIIAIAGMSRMAFFKQVVNRLITDNIGGGGMRFKVV